MSLASRVGDSMAGSVRHHSNHIIGWTGGEDPQPIYCSGHSVTGTQTSGSGNVISEGSQQARIGDGGTTTCPCCGGPYTNVEGSGTVFVNGSGAVRTGDSVDIHGQGTGVMTSGAGTVIIGG